MIINLKGTVRCDRCDKLVDVVVPMEFHPDLSYRILHPRIPEGGQRTSGDELLYLCAECLKINDEGWPT
jgi:hypothetical protein